MKRKYADTFTVYLILLKAVFAQNSDRFDSAQICSELAQRLQENTEKENVGSVIAAVTEGDQIIWSDHFGWVAKEKKSVSSEDEKYGYGLGVSVWTDKGKRRWIYHNGIADEFLYRLGKK